MSFALPFFVFYAFVGFRIPPVAMSRASEFFHVTNKNLLFLLVFITFWPFVGGGWVTLLGVLWREFPSQKPSTCMKNDSKRQPDPGGTSFMLRSILMLPDLEIPLKNEK